MSEADFIPDRAPPGRVVFIRAPRRLSDEELAMALAGLEEGSPVWLAVNQILDEEFASAVLDASASTLDPSRGTFPGGKIAALAELKDRLHRTRATVLRVPAGAKRRA